MPHNETTLTNQKGIILYKQDWLPDTNLQGIILLVHGLGEHSSRYLQLAENLNRWGYGIISFDLEGHGKSQGKRGHIPSYEAAMDDIALFLEDTTRCYPGIPCFLYGHSLGGALVLYYILSRKPSISGAVITSPALSSKEPVSPAKLSLAKMMARVYPSFTMQNGLNVNGLSHDAEIVQKYVKDPLVHPMISASLGRDLFAKGEWIRNQHDVSIPMLIMQGSADCIVDPQAVRDFALNLKGDVEYKEWEGLFHELHNEFEKEEIMAYILTWLRKHTPQSK